MPAHPRRAAVGALLVLALVLLAALAVSQIHRLRPDRCEATAAGTTVDFDPEQMNHAATIVQLGLRRGLPARAGSIAVATAIQESKLRNLTYGDRDSLGLFQQRPSQGWGTPEQLQDPVYATGAFYDALVEVEGWQAMVITEIAQEVQRSAYPSAYADHETEGRTIASVVGGHSPAGMVCDLDPADRPGRPDTLVAAVREQTGQVGTRADSPDGPTVTVPTGDPTRAWGIGAWAVAQAQARQITRVQVGDQVWERGDDGWASADDPVAAGTVVLTLHP